MSDKNSQDKPRPRMVKPPAEKKDATEPVKPRMVTPPAEKKDATEPVKPRMVTPPAEKKDAARPAKPRMVTPPAGEAVRPRHVKPPAAAAPARRRPGRPPAPKSRMPLLLGGAAVVILVVVVALVMNDSGTKPAKTSEDKGRKTADKGVDRPGQPPVVATAGEEEAGDPARDIKEEYERKKILAENDIEILDLARWCKEQGLKKEMQEAAGILLKKNPDHSEVHQLLGHRLFEGEHPDFQDRWLTSEEYSTAMEKEKAYLHKRATDPKFDAMEHAISNARHQYLRDFKHFAVCEWPYVLIVEDFGSKVRNDFYSQEKLDQVRSFYAFIRKNFPGLLTKEPDIPFRVIVFKDAASYNRFNTGTHSGKGGSGGSGSRARAHFSLRTKFVYYYEKNAKGSTFDAETTLGVLFHECTHQLLNFLRPAKNPWSDSMWFEEAFAEYIGAVKKTGKYKKDEKGEDRMTFHLACPNKYRLPAILARIHLKHIFPLPTMFRCRTYEEANQAFRLKHGIAGGHGQSILYCQGWSFVYFCMNEPSGKYRDKMIKYIEKDVAGDSGYSTLCECFGLANHDELWKPIEREWLVYVRKLGEELNLKGIWNQPEKKKKKKKKED